MFSDPESSLQSAVLVGRIWRNAFLRRYDVKFETPEHIDNSPVTAPSKRILDLYSPNMKSSNG